MGKLFARWGLSLCVPIGQSDPYFGGDFFRLFFRGGAKSIEETSTVFSVPQPPLFYNE